MCGLLWEIQDKRKRRRKKLEETSVSCKLTFLKLQLKLHKTEEGRQIKERMRKEVNNDQTEMDERGKKASDGVLPDCPGGGMPPVPLGNRTKMESTAALLPKQGSRAMGFGTDCGKEKETDRKIKVLHTTSLSNPGEHTPLSKTWITEALLLLFLFVSATCTEERNLFHPPVEIHTLICGTNWIHPLPSEKILHCAQFHDNAACVQLGPQLDIKWHRWEQRFVSEKVAAGGCRRGLPRAPESVIPISPVYQQLIHMWG